MSKRKNKDGIHFTVFFVLHCILFHLSKRNTPEKDLKVQLYEKSRTTVFFCKNEKGFFNCCLF